MDFILATENLPFTVALSVMFAIAALEGIGALFGLGVSALLETALPDIDLDFDGPDLESSTTLSHFLSWLRIGKVPFLIIIVVFLTSFGIIGLVLQQIFFGLTGSFINGWILAIPAWVVSLPCVRFFSGTFARFVPQDETEVVSTESFIGRTAEITLGTAKSSSPAEAKLQDEFNQTHYIMVEPDNKEDIFKSNTQVLIVRKSGSVFKVIESPDELLN